MGKLLVTLILSEYCAKCMQAGQHLTNCIPNGVCLDLTQNEIALIKKKKKKKPN